MAIALSKHAALDWFFHLHKIGTLAICRLQNVADHSPGAIATLLYSIFYEVGSEHSCSFILIVRQHIIDLRGAGINHAFGRDSNITHAIPRILLYLFQESDTDGQI